MSTQKLPIYAIIAHLTEKLGSHRFLCTTYLIILYFFRSLIGSLKRNNKNNLLVSLPAMSAPVQRSPEDPPPQVTATIGKSRTSSLQQKVKRIYLWALLFLWLFNTQWLWFCYKINNEFKSSPHFENDESIGRILYEYIDWKLNNFGHFRNFDFGQFEFSAFLKYLK